MKFRAWLALVLFLHLLGHPLVHGLSFATKPAGKPAVSAPKPAPQTTRPAEDCPLCRSSVALAQPAPALFSPERNTARPVVLKQFVLVLFAPQQNVPARAPPIL